jgi:hypothetical protein
MRRRFLLAIAIFVLLTGAAAAGLGLLVHHEPEFYRLRAIPAGQERKQNSKDFQQKFSYVGTAALDGYGFKATFTEEQLNSYFQDDSFFTTGFDKMLPSDISEPRIALEPDRIRLGFRYGEPPWSTIISIDLGVWLAPKEPNVVVLELRGLRAGSLPISAQSLLEKISDIARRKNIDVNWYRHNGNPVALVHFATDSRSGVQLQQLELGAGKLTLVGRALENTPRAAAGRPGLTPHAN